MAEQPTRETPPSTATETADAAASGAVKDPAPRAEAVPEIGGPEGPEPTRYGDWEKKGRCIDF